MTVTYIDGEGQEQTLDVSPSGDVTIPAGVTDITVTITTTQDDVYEGAESFGLVVTESGGITSNGVASGEAVIRMMAQLSVQQRLITISRCYLLAVVVILMKGKKHYLLFLCLIKQSHQSLSIWLRARVAHIQQKTLTLKILS
ncbi:hypothetical protein D0856_06895 [Vibrio owensii]|nr:hypothetical protein D0856_06895 [Vibrio owensii]